MNQAQIKRLIVLSAYGVGESFQTAGCIAKLAYKTMVKDVYADKAKSEHILTTSNLIWTCVYPVILTDNALFDDVGTVLLTRLRKVKGLPKVSRANVAQTMLDVILDNQTFEQKVVVCPEKNIVK